MRYADREVRARRTAKRKRMEPARKARERERGREEERARGRENERETGREKKVQAHEGQREREKVRGREKENERGISVHGVGERGSECEGYEGWCKGDGEAGGSASNEESQRLTKKKDGRFNSLIAQRSERRRAG